MLYTIIVIIVLIFVLVLLFTKNKDTYIMTLGGYGKSNPISCYESRPRNGLCYSCNLQCGPHQYLHHCSTCLETLNHQ